MTGFIAIRGQKGFTLLEILVALTILAVALAAVVRASSSAIQSTDALRTRILAQWVAENRLAELRLARSWPGPGVTNGEAPMLGERFQWKQTVSPSPSSNFRRLELQVMGADGAVQARLVTYLTWP